MNSPLAIWRVDSAIPVYVYLPMQSRLSTPSLMRPPHLKTTFSSVPWVVALESFYCIFLVNNGHTATKVHVKGKLAHKFTTCYKEFISCHLRIDKLFITEENSKN